MRYWVILDHTNHAPVKRSELLIATLLIWHLALRGQEVPAQGTLIDTIDTRVDLFNVADPMDITLTLNLKEYQRRKYRDEYVPVHFYYQINDTLGLEKSMRIKARGEFRRDHCTFAPFWLNIRKADVKNQHLQDVKRIKIVTHCRSQKDYKTYVLKEYLTYKIFNLLSPVSFRVRLIRMTYVDTGRKNRVTGSWAFMIEPEEVLAERHNAVVIKKDELGMKFMEPGSMDLVAMFMYMIGNPDFSIAGRHNIKILGLPGFGSEGYTPVPYDFDYTGLVNALYAQPGEGLGISSVEERYFLGPCRSEEEHQLAINRIEEHREEILGMIDSFPYLGGKEKLEMITYLDSYFERVKRPGFIQSELNRTCR